jgi:soluble lytic murein transglycosylase-like protein
MNGRRLAILALGPAWLGPASLALNPAAFAKDAALSLDPITAEAAAPADDVPLPSPVATPTAYRALAKAEASGTGLPPEIADAVMAVESGYNPGVIGGAGEIGLMQILPSTARMLGFAGSLTDLAVPKINIHYGVSYLAEAWRLSGGDLCTAVMKYRAGHGETRFSYRSVDYCLAVRGKLRARGFPITGSVPVATFGEARGSLTSSCRKGCLSLSRGRQPDFNAINSHLNALVSQIGLRIRQR